MKCCGYDRVTPFCPMCGKILGSEPLAGLLRQCKLNMETYAKQVDRCEDYSSKYYKDGVRLHKRWKERYDALNELLSKGDNNDL